MPNGIQEQHGLYGTFQHWYKESKITAKDVEGGDGKSKPRRVVAYVLAHLDKFSPKVRKQVDVLRQAFRALGYADAEALKILTGDLKAGALALVEKGKAFEQEAAKQPAEAARFLGLAEKAYRLALELRPHTKLAHQGLAALLYRQGKTEEGRRHTLEAIMRTEEKQLPELVSWLETLGDPEIKKKGAVQFAGEVLAKDSNYKSAASLYGWASLEAAKKGDTVNAQLYAEKCLLADELAKPYKLGFTEKSHPGIFELYQAFRAAGIPSGVIKGNRPDKRWSHDIDRADVLAFIDKNIADPRVQEVLKERGLYPPPWEAAGASSVAASLTYTAKLSAYHGKQATAAQTEQERFLHLFTAAEFGIQNVSAQMYLGHY